jgi:3-oxoadipate enol-lactonase
MSAPDTSRRLEVEGGLIAYEVAGRGPSIVLIHEGIADRRVWSREFKLLARNHHVVRYDLRGFGASSKAVGPFSHLRDLADLIKHLRFRKPVVVGASVGGLIAIDFALAHPSSLAGLFLIAPAVSGLEFSMVPDAKAAFEEDDRISQAAATAWREGRTDDAVEGLRKLWGAALEGAALELFRTMARDNGEEIFNAVSGKHFQPQPERAARRLSEIHVPTTIAVGDRDNPVSVHIARYIASGIGGSTLLTIPRGDHLLNLSQPDAFDAALTDFLRRMR